MDVSITHYMGANSKSSLLIALIDQRLVFSSGIRITASSVRDRTNWLLLDHD